MRLFRKKPKGTVNKRSDSFISPKIQHKLSVGKAGDKYEKEADHVADKVVNKTDTTGNIQKKGVEDEEIQQKPIAESISTVQREAIPEEDQPTQKKVEEEEEPVQKQGQEEDETIQQKGKEEEEPVQKQEDDEEQPVQQKGMTKEEEKPVQTMQNEQISNSVDSENIENELANSNDNGNIMDPETLTEMETGFGAEFSNVNIHTDNKAEQMNQELGAQAFTQGNNIYFNKGKYNPKSKEGKHLLAHELTHTIQQGKNRPAGKKIQKQEEPDVKPNYCSHSTGGFNIAFYDAATDETARRAKDWAKNFNAVGLSNKGDLKANTAISDKNDVSKTIINVSEKVGLSCNEDKSPLKVKNLAIFAHGTEDWCGIGNAGITGRKAKTLVKKIAPHLSEDVNVILYACSVARGPSEKENWKKGTLDSGGKDSLADKFSDTLNENNLKKAKVWGHTTVGHTSRNFALRSFSSSDKSNVGSSYVSEYVFTPYEVFLIKNEVVNDLNDQGYVTDPVEENYPEWFFKNLRSHFYSAYAKANENKKYKGMNLAEAAPVYPNEVAEVINEYWKNDYWPKNKKKFTEKVIKDLNLKTSTP